MATSGEQSEEGAEEEGAEEEGAEETSPFVRIWKPDKKDRSRRTKMDAILDESKSIVDIEHNKVIYQYQLLGNIIQIQNGNAYNINNPLRPVFITNGVTTNVLSFLELPYRTIKTMVYNGKITSYNEDLNTYRKILDDIGAENASATVKRGDKFIFLYKGGDNPFPKTPTESDDELASEVLPSSESPEKTSMSDLERVAQAGLKSHKTKTQTKSPKTKTQKRNEQRRRKKKSSAEGLSNITPSRKFHPYKIGPNGEFGKLNINMPHLNRLLLTAKKGNKRICHQPCPYDLVELLTKKYNTRKKYHPEAINLFQKLVHHAELPVESTYSHKFKNFLSGGAPMEEKTGGCACGEGVQVFSNPDEVATRLKCSNRGSKCRK